MLPFTMQDLYKCVCKGNSKEICEEMSLSSLFFPKNADASIFWRFKANCLEKMRGFTIFLCGFQ